MDEHKRTPILSNTLNCLISATAHYTGVLTETILALKIQFFKMGGHYPHPGLLLAGMLEEPDIDTDPDALFDLIEPFAAEAGQSDSNIRDLCVRLSTDILRCVRGFWNAEISTHSQLYMSLADEI